MDSVGVGKLELTGGTKGLASRSRNDAERDVDDDAVPSCASVGVACES